MNFSGSVTIMILYILFYFNFIYLLSCSCFVCLYVHSFFRFFLFFQLTSSFLYIFLTYRSIATRLVVDKAVRRHVSWTCGTKSQSPVAIRLACCVTWVWEKRGFPLCEYGAIFSPISTTGQGLRFLPRGAYLQNVAAFLNFWNVIFMSDHKI